MSAISFNQIPVDIFRPGFFVEIDPTLSSSGLPVFQQRIVMTGQMGTGATAVAGELVRVISEAEARALFGGDSMLFQMVQTFRKANPYQQLNIVPLVENDAGAAATGSIVIAGTALLAGTLSVYIAEKRYQVGASSGVGATDIANDLADVINADADAIVTAVATNGTVALTVKWKGESGNQFGVFARYYDTDRIPAGLSVTANAMSGGTGNPDIQPMLDALDDLEMYQGFVMPYTDQANIDLMRAELDARWGPLSARDGTMFCALTGGVATQAAWALARNSEHVCVMDMGGATKSPSWNWAAAVAAVAMYFGATDPARPFQTLELVGIEGMPEGKRRAEAQREALLAGGVSTHIVGDDGKVRIESLFTTYTQNGQGAEDEAYRNLNTKFIMSWWRRVIVNRFQLKFPRHKLAANGQPGTGAASNIITPEGAEAEFLAAYSDAVDIGYMMDLDGYKADLLADKNGQKRGRLDVMDRPRPIDQFRQLAVRSSFFLI